MNAPRKILVVDDDPILRGAIVFDLKRNGFEVLEAENGDEAYRIVEKTKIDLVLSDMRMPVADGMTLLEKIRIIDPKIPAVIFLTGFSDYTEEECLAKGANKVLQKPCDRKTLLDAIRETLSSA